MTGFMLIITRVAFLIFLLVFLVGGIFLQIYLAKKESKLFGLILPLITFSISLVVVLNMVVFTSFEYTSFTTSVIISQPADAEWVPTEIVERETAETVTGGTRNVIPGAIGGVIFTFIIMNIPTIVLLGVFKAVRNKQNRRRDVEKMSVQDL